MRKLENLGRSLNREQMRSILGGVAPVGHSCQSGTSCSLVVSSGGSSTTYYGNCTETVSGTSIKCWCSTPYGAYEPIGGLSHCWSGA